MDDVELLKPVKPLTPTQGLQNVQGLQDVTPLTFGQQKYTQPFRLKDSNVEKANSLVDVLLSGDQRDELLEDTWFDWAKNIPIVDQLAGTLVHIGDAYIDPVVKNGVFNGQGYKEIGLNVLTELSEDLDIFSNIIKSQMDTAGGSPGLDTLAKSVGIGGHRVIYNHNTGNTLADIGLEIISDPLTVIGFAKSIVGSIAKTTAKSATAEIAQQAAKEVGKNLSDDTAGELSKIIIKNTTKEISEEAAEQVLKKAGKEITEEAVEKTIKEMRDTAITNAVKKSTNKSLSRISKKKLSQIIDATTTGYKATNYYKAFTQTAKLGAAVNTLDSAITKTALAVTPVGLPLYAIKKSGVVPKIFNALTNELKTKITQYNLDRAFTKAQSKYKDALQGIFIENNAYNETIFKNNIKFFRQLNIDSTDAQILYYKMLKTIDVDNEKDLIDAFKTYLTNNNTRFKTLLNTDISFNKFVSSEGFDELVSAISVGPSAIVSVERELKMGEAVANINSITKNLKNKQNILDSYFYINDTLLSINGKQYGLSNLTNYINDLIKSGYATKDYLQQVANLLEQYGINKDNADAIARVLNSKIKDKTAAIKRIISRSSDAKILTDKDYLKLAHKSTNRIADGVDNEMSKLFKDKIAKLNEEKYKSILQNSFKDMKGAVNKLKADVDVEHAYYYIKNVIRQQELPGIKEANTLIDQAVAQVPTIDKATVKEVKQFLKDTTKIMEDIQNTGKCALDIPAWYDSLKSIDKKIASLQTTLINEGGPYAVKGRAILSRLQASIDVFKNAKVRDSIFNYMDDLTGMMYSQLSYQGMFNVLTQYTHLSSSPALKQFMDEVSVPDSILRTQILPQTIQALQDAKLYTQADTLTKTLAQIDTTVNLNKLLNADLAFPFDTTNQFNTSIKSIVFDTIRNKGNYCVADVLADTLEENVKYKSITDEINRHITKTKAITKDIEEISIKTGIPIKDIQDAVIEQAQSLFKNYLIDQSKIIGVPNLSLYSVYDLTTVNALDFGNNIRFALARNNPNFNIEILNNYDTVMIDFQRFADGIQMGIDKIQEINNTLQVPLSKKEATDLIQKVAKQQNLYSSSIASTMYVTNYIIPSDFTERFLLSSDNFVGTNDELMLLADRLNWFKDTKFDDYLLEDKRIKEIREALIKTYSQPNALFAPANPRAYFNSLGANELVIWETVTKGNLSIKNKTNFYTFLKPAEQRTRKEVLNNTPVITELETIARNRRFIKSNEYDSVIEIANNIDAMKELNRYIDLDLMDTLHDINDLDKYYDDIVYYLKHDVANQDAVTQAIIDIENDPAIRMSFEEFGNYDDLRLLTKASYGYEDASNMGQMMIYAERKASLATAVSRFNAEELATHIYKYTPGAMAFQNANIIRELNPDGSVTWKGLDNIFNFTKEELDAAGLQIKQVDDWYFIRLTDNRIHNAKLDYGSLGTNYNHIQRRYTDIIDKQYAYLNLDADDVPTNMITVEGLNKDVWDEFMKQNEDFFGDLEEQKLYQKMQDITVVESGKKVYKETVSTFFSNSYERLNLAIIGGTDSYNDFHTMLNIKDYIPKSPKMNKNTYQGLTAFIKRTNQINKYMSIFFNGDYALDSPLLKTMFSNASDARIKEFFAEGKYVGAILRKDKQGLPRVFSYAITDRASLNKAISAGAIMVPKDTFINMRLVINSRQMSNDLLSIYRRVIPSTYKSMYLFTAGFPFRNGIDSLILKNGNELGGLEALPKIFRYEREASKAIELHNEIQQKVLALTNGETFNKESLFKVLNEEYSANEANLYFLVELFKESPADGNLSKAMEEFLSGYNLKDPSDIRMLWEKVYENKILYGTQKWNPLNWVRDLNSHIEETARLGLFLGLIDEGFDTTSAISKVVKTHFNYNSTSDLLDICERIFWFSTFPINNFNYYVNGGLTKAPTMLKMIMDTQTASWNNGEYTYEELKNTDFLSYHALTGNIRVGNYVIKTSPSFFDFLSMATDPFGNAKDRLRPVFAIAVDPKEAMKSKEYNPMISQVRNFKKFIEGNPIPSIISDINTFDYTKYFGKTNRRYYSSWNSYPRIKRPVAYIRYVRKYYSRRYRTDVRKSNRVSLYHDAIRYYRLNKTGYRDL